MPQAACKLETPGSMDQSVRGALEDTGVNSGVQRMESLELWSQGRDKLSRVRLIG